MKPFLLLFAFIACVSSFNENRIFGGDDTPENIFHNVVKFKAYGFRKSSVASNLIKFGICTGTIISKRHILTAAHCVTNRVTHNIFFPASFFLIDYRPAEVQYYPGAIDLKPYGFVSTFHYHPQWQYNLYRGYDVAILEFSKDINFGIEPVKLAKDFVESDNDYAIAAGYGKYDTVDANGKPIFEFPKTLQYHTSIKIHSSHTKERLDRAKFIITGNTTDRADEGDSGGPLFINQTGSLYQVGLTSFKKSKNAEHAIYTRLSYYCSWIEEITQGEAKCISMHDEIPMKQQLILDIIRSQVLAANDIVTNIGEPIEASNGTYEVDNDFDATIIEEEYIEKPFSFPITINLPGTLFIICGILLIIILCLNFHGANDHDGFDYNGHHPSGLK